MMNNDLFFERQRLECDQLAAQNRLGEAKYLAEKNAYDALMNLGLFYVSKTQDYQSALNCFYEALKILQGDWVCWCNICHVYTKLYQMDSALEAALKSIKYSHNSSYGCFYNTGVILLNLGRHNHAELMFRESLALNSDHISSKYNLAMCLLAQKKYEEGWLLYEHRFDEGDLTRKCKAKFSQPHWDGQPITDKSLVIYSEQGLGDFIFFSRFLAKIRPLVGKLIVEVQNPLVELVKANFDVDEVIGRDNSLSSSVISDFCQSVCSLPRILKINSDLEIPNMKYIQGNNIKLNKIKNIAICWAGSPSHKKDFNRSIPILEWSPLLLNKNYNFFSFMVNTPTKRIWEGKEINLNYGIENFEIQEINQSVVDFQKISELLSDMDLIVTVDTGFAHLCGAMGKKVFIVLARENDWRWGIDTNNCIWYPTATLFRKKTTWHDLFVEVNSVISSQNDQDLQDISYFHDGNTD